MEDTGGSSAWGTMEERKGPHMEAIRERGTRVCGSVIAYEGGGRSPGWALQA